MLGMLFLIQGVLNFKRGTNMSGGHFDYIQYRISDIVTEIEELVKSNDDDNLDKFGDTVGRGYSKETIERFKIGIQKLQEAQIYAQRIDWLVSGDDGEETFHKRLQEDLDSIGE